MFNEFEALSATRVDPPRKLLVERADLQLGKDGPESLLVRGDNDHVLEVMADSLKGKVKCVYIDPPYNNMESYVHYDDTDAHEEWLHKLTRHIERLKSVLTEDGSLWVSIDDHQVHYLKVALDEIFGRSNFVTTVVWEHRKSRENRRAFSNNHEYVLVYAKNLVKFKKVRNRLPYTREVTERFKNPDKDPRGPWQSVSVNVQAGHATKAQFYSISAPNGMKHSPPNGRCWMYNAERTQQLIKDGRIWFGKNGEGVPRLKRFLSEIDGGLTPQTLWRADEVGTTDSAKKELLKQFPNEPVFDTPKPEQLISRIFGIAAKPGDLVLDSFLGSGTSAVAAIRSNLRFVGIELGGQMLSHCHKRVSEIASAREICVRYLELQS